MRHHSLKRGLQHHGDKKQFGGGVGKSTKTVFKTAIMSAVGGLLGFFKKARQSVKEWRPNFSSAELEFGRSISHRGERTRFFRKLRTDYFKKTPEFTRVIDEKYYGKNYLYM